MQHIIAHETDIPLTADPLGGSYFLEHLTNQMEEEIDKLLQKIDRMGGIDQALESGWMRREFDDAEQERQREIEEIRRIVVGVNEFIVPREQEIRIKIFEPNVQKAREKALARFEKFKEKRNIERVKKSLLDLYGAAKRDENLVRYGIGAFKADATIGELMGVIRQGYGYSYDPFNLIERPEFLQL
jgi:methylmalonyl-CoA mutase N-terminal domain/subunit